MTLHIRDNIFLLTFLHAASVKWLQARKVHLASKAPFAGLYKQMLYPSLCLTPWHTETHTRSEYATRFITIKISPKGIETH